MNLWIVTDQPSLQFDHSTLEHDPAPGDAAADTNCAGLYVPSLPFQLLTHLCTTTAPYVREEDPSGSPARLSEASVKTLRHLRGTISLNSQTAACQA